MSFCIGIMLAALVICQTTTWSITVKGVLHFTVSYETHSRKGKRRFKTERKLDPYFKVL